MSYSRRLDVWTVRALSVDGYFNECAAVFEEMQRLGVKDWRLLPTHIKYSAQLLHEERLRRGWQLRLF